MNKTICSIGISLLILSLMSITAVPARKFHGVYLHPNGEDAWACDMEGCIFYSADGGRTWNLQGCPTSLDLFDIYMVSFKKGWAVGLQGELLHTTNGGYSWFRQSYGLSKYLTRIDCFADSDTLCWVAGGDAIVLRTEDFGEHWAAVFTNLDTDFWGISFVDSLRGWVVGGRIFSEEPGGQGLILHTTAGGDTWEIQAVDTMEIDTLTHDTLKYGHDFMDVEFLDTLTGWVVGGDDIANTPWALHSTDGGLTWDTCTVMGNGILRAVDFVNENLGWAVGEYGTILHTTDGGNTWSSLSRNSQAHLFDICFIDSLHGLIAGDSSSLLYTENGGEEWAQGSLPFLRGDPNSDQQVGMPDAVFILRYKFVPGSPPPPCMDAGDSNDDGTVGMPDAVYILRHKFVPGSPPPPPPFPGCGPDPTPDELDCEDHPCMG